MSDWHSEIDSRLTDSLIYQTLKSKTEEANDKRTLALVDEIVYDAYSQVKIIIKYMPEFTLHDGEHLFRVLYLMEKLVPQSTISKLSIPELMLLVLTSFVHDIGMAPSDAEASAWKKVWDVRPNFSDEDDEKEYQKFLRFYNSKPNTVSEIRKLIAEGKNSNADLVKGYLITDYIRITHATRARDYIGKIWDGKVKFRDVDLTLEFAQLCLSHSEDALKLAELDKMLLCSQNTYACLPFIGVILRLADILDFDVKRTPNILFSHLAVKNPISLKEWRKHRAIEAWEINSKQIKYHAKCSHPAIEASIREFCDIIDKELIACKSILSDLPSQYHFELPDRVDRSKIEPKKDISGTPVYIYRHTQFTLSKKQVIDLLMGTKLYGSTEVALRELIQNSIDACLLRNDMEKKWGNAYQPKITVKYFSEDNQDILEVEDNGTGMDQHIIDNFYSRVGSSFYKSPEYYDIRALYNSKFNPTSRFGIGILSCFMVADTLQVDTRRLYDAHDSSKPIQLLIEGQESIFWIKDGRRKIPGTTTKLYLREVNPWHRMDDEEFIKSVEDTITNPPFEIEIITDKERKIRNEHSYVSTDFIAELKKAHWESHENIREFEIELNSDSLKGTVIVGVLEKDTTPVESIDVTSRNVDVEGVDYELKMHIKTATNKIVLASTSLTLDDEGDVREESYTRYLAESKSKLSLHGIEVPTTLFPSLSSKKQQADIQWPFPAIIILDIGKALDIDLNSSRTQIISNEKWFAVEEMLLERIFEYLKVNTKEEYWNQLISIWNKNSYTSSIILKDLLKKHVAG